MPMSKGQKGRTDGSTYAPGLLVLQQPAHNNNPNPWGNKGNLISPNRPQKHMAPVLNLKDLREKIPQQLSRKNVCVACNFCINYPNFNARFTLL